MGKKSEVDVMKIKALREFEMQCEEKTYSLPFLQMVMNSFATLLFFK